MPSDALVTVPGSGAAPLSYAIAPAQEIVLKAAFATFDGASAASSWLPCLRILAPTGQVVGEYCADSALAVGASAEVSFAPFLSVGTTEVSVLGPIGTKLDYAEAPAGVFNVAATSATAADLWIQGHAVDFDGVSTAKVVVWSALAHTDRDIVMELFMDNVDQGRIGQYSPATVAQGVSLIGIGHVTPSSGSHTFDIRVWMTAGATSSMLNPTPFPSVAFQPSHMEITVSSPIP